MQIFLAKMMLICYKTEKEARFGPLFVLFFILWHPPRVAWVVSVARKCGRRDCYSFITPFSLRYATRSS